MAPKSVVGTTLFFLTSEGRLLAFRQQVYCCMLFQNIKFVSAQFLVLTNVDPNQISSHMQIILHTESCVDLYKKCEAWLLTRIVKQQQESPEAVATEQSLGRLEERV